jgi:hypothetical protein
MGKGKEGIWDGVTVGGGEGGSAHAPWARRGSFSGEEAGSEAVDL